MCANTYVTVKLPAGNPHGLFCVQAYKAYKSMKVGQTQMHPLVAETIIQERRKEARYDHVRTA